MPEFNVVWLQNVGCPVGWLKDLIVVHVSEFFNDFFVLILQTLEIFNFLTLFAVPIANLLVTGKIYPEHFRLVAAKDFGLTLDSHLPIKWIPPQK